jgi:NAD+ synthase (glutamine-hydrolysing)
MYYQDYLKVGLVVPKVTIGQPMTNALEILKVANREQKAEVLLFPELGLTGYSIGDLFFNQQLQKENLEALAKILQENRFSGILLIGAPLDIKGQLYNCAIVIQKNRILGVVPKLYFPEMREFVESRYFASGKNLLNHVETIEVLGEEVPFGNIIFSSKEHDVNFAIEVCADLWSVRNLNEDYYLNGAQMVFNLSASTFNLGKGKRRRTLTDNASLKGSGAYVYVSSGVTETSSDVLFSGHALVSCCGENILDCERLVFDTVIYYSDINLGKIRFERNVNCYLRNNEIQNLRNIKWDLEESGDYEFEKPVDLEPFVPKTDEDCDMIAKVQAASVYQRLLHIHSDKTVLGISGGLDSTLSLLSLVRMCDTYGLDRSNIIAVTMPALATTDKSKSLALRLMKALKVTILEIPVKDEVQSHLTLIGHDTKTKDATYENAQARYRTMVLMDLANKHKGIVIGTSDTSEIALGWATFNGDQMAMYGINAGIPKTVVRKMVSWYEQIYPEAKEMLEEVVHAPITPELKNDQNTEDIIGKYEINDFIMYHYLGCGASFDKILFLLEKGFGLKPDEGQKYINNFVSRFKTQQYKRLSSPEAVKIFALSLSPRGDFRLSGDIK